MKTTLMALNSIARIMILNTRVIDNFKRNEIKRNIQKNTHTLCQKREMFLTENRDKQNLFFSFFFF